MPSFGNAIVKNKCCFLAITLNRISVLLLFIYCNSHQTVIFVLPRFPSKSAFLWDYNKKEGMSCEKENSRKNIITLACICT